METNRGVRWDRWMRARQLYTGLFLVPWMTVYAVSAFSLNHKEWFTEELGLISGIYLWARRPRRWLLGGLCLMAGTVLLAILAVLLCR